MELLVQAPNNTPWFCILGLSLLPVVIFWNSFLGLGTMSNFHDCSVEDSGFFLVCLAFRDKYSPLVTISYPNIRVEASREKYLLQEILQKWKKDQKGPTEAAEIQLFPPGCLCLVISHGYSDESTTSALGVQNPTWNKCFCLADDLPFGNNSCNYPKMVWKQEQMLARLHFLIFSPLQVPVSSQRSLGVTYRLYRH